MDYDMTTRFQMFGGGTEDEYWINRSLALRVAHEEYLDENVLDQMSISDILQLRTKAWGEQADARDGLMKSGPEISLCAESLAQTEQWCCWLCRRRIIF
jgi:hypothetical protein